MNRAAPAKWTRRSTRLLTAAVGGALLLTLMLMGTGPGAAAAAVPDTAPVSASTPDVAGETGMIENGSVGVDGVADSVADSTTDSATGVRPALLPGLAEGGCGILDALCGGGLPLSLPGLPGVPGMGSLLDLGEDIPGLGDVSNPIAALGDVIARAAADAWSAAMLGFWSAGLYVLRVVLALAELFLTPDLSPGGPGRDVYAYSLWIALALVVMMTMVQLGVAALRREGKSLARTLIGAGQFVVVCSSWFFYCAMVITATAALNKAIMKALLGVNTWSEWDPLGEVGVENIADAAVATVLGLLGLVLWIAAIGHLLVYLARAAALLILAATGPIAAAGLVSDAGRSWFWKSLRWFHAAAFTPVLMTLVLGIGIQMSTGVAAGLADDTAKAIGTALPAVMLICVSAVAPLALFKLLAFVDPGTPSGASFRQGMALQGGIQGLLAGSSSQSAGGAGGSGSASTADANGRSAGEKGAEESTSSRFNGATQGMLGKLGPVGAGVATGLGVLASAGGKGASLLADESNQSGVGHQTYGPDFSGARIGQSHSIPGGHRGGADTADGSSDGSDDGNNDGGSDSGSGGTPPSSPPPPAPALRQPSVGTGAQHGQGEGGAGGSGAPKTPAAGGTGGAGGGAAAGSVPPIPA